MNLTAEEVRRFREKIRRFYRSHGRVLPWRKTTNPYRITVSEIMLQQTQVERVVRKYPEFIREFPDFTALARASLAAVIARWQGMGYNRRAIALKRLAENVVADHGGRLPDTPEALVTLPGIGPATAASITVFAFNRPVVFIETNIRRVFIHHFFEDTIGVTDRDLLPYVERTLDRKNPRDWYNALMDYGAMLAGRVPNPNRRSAHYTRQSRFEGSNRQVRGQVLKLLAENGKISKVAFRKRLDVPVDRLEAVLAGLETEGFIQKTLRSYTLKH